MTNSETEIPRWIEQLVARIESRLPLELAPGPRIDDVLSWLSSRDTGDSDLIGGALKDADVSNPEARAHVLTALDRLLFDHPEDQPWNILGLSPDAEEQEIKQRYRRLMQIYHPDKSRDNEQWLAGRSEIVNRAYSRWSTERRAREYHPGEQDGRPNTHYANTTRVEEAYTRDNISARSFLGSGYKIKKLVFGGFFAVCAVTIFAMTVAIVSERSRQNDIPGNLTNMGHVEFLQQHSPDALGQVNSATESATDQATDPEEDRFTTTISYDRANIVVEPRPQETMDTIVVATKIDGPKIDVVLAPRYTEFPFEHLDSPKYRYPEKLNSPTIVSGRSMAGLMLPIVVRTEVEFRDKINAAIDTPTGESTDQGSKSDSNAIAENSYSAGEPVMNADIAVNRTLQQNATASVRVREIIGDLDHSLNSRKASILSKNFIPTDNREKDAVHPAEGVEGAQSDSSQNDGTAEAAEQFQQQVVFLRTPSSAEKAIVRETLVNYVKSIEDGDSALLDQALDQHVMIDGAIKSRSEMVSDYQTLIRNTSQRNYDVHIIRWQVLTDNTVLIEGRTKIRYQYKNAPTRVYQGKRNYRFVISGDSAKLKAVTGDDR